MTYLSDFFSVLGASIAIFAVTERGSLAVVLLGGMALAGFCWWGCSTYSRLWNIRYRVTLLHHMCCSIAAVLTLAASVVFVALKHAREASAVSVEAWEQQLGWDQAWARKTFGVAYHRVKALGIEDFTKYPAPPAGTSIPATSERAQFACAQTYAKSAASHFTTSRPFLSSIISARSEVPADVLRTDIKGYFASGEQSYPAAKGIALVAAEVKGGLRAHLPRVVNVLRSSLAGIFFLGQLVPFGLVGWAAYRDLKARI